MHLTPVEPWVARKIGLPGRVITRAEIEAYQRDRLEATLQLARQKSQFYQRRLAGGSDLASLPFTTADDIRANPLQFLCVSQDEIRRVVTLDSSGTTGIPKRIYFTQADQELTIDFFQVGMSTFTAPGDRVLILLPGNTPGSVGDLLASALGRLGALGIKHGPVRDVHRTLDVIMREHINVAVGIPVNVLRLVRSVEAKMRPAPRLKSVLLTTDHVPDAIKRAVEATWGCAVYNHYGATEMGLGGGVECEARLGYHLREADLLVEIVDPATGERAPDGEIGEVVFSTLTRQGMPLIRYRTGDISRFIPERCACGTTLKTLERVRDRTAGVVSLREGVSLSMADLDEALFAVEGVLDFTAALHHDNGEAVLHVEAAVAADADTSSPVLHAALQRIPACRSGALRVVIEVRPGEPTPPLMAGKRTISIDSDILDRMRKPGSKSPQAGPDGLDLFER
jgi:phenylacetate-coenzyme A ligase PaaK-like adenylate-forming protein